MRADADRAADGAGRQQPLDTGRGRRTLHARPAAAFPGPSLLARACWEEQQVTAQAARGAIERLDDGDPGHTVLIIDETAGATSSTDAAGAARQDSGALGGVALCQVMPGRGPSCRRHLARAHHPRPCPVPARALYLPEHGTADEEHREPARIPQDTMCATTPRLAGELLEGAHAAGVRAAYGAGDEVYAGEEVDGGCRLRALDLGSGPGLWTWATCRRSAPAPRCASTRGTPSPPSPLTATDALCLIPVSSPSHPRRRLDAAAHRQRHHGRPPRRLGDARPPARRHPRRAGGRA
ncbi:transposase [Thermoactinospora rubra]|uniref:transposase n=1 Tax=Thermoactinospora rubra TaxID=1088767 RepID=UPI000A10DCA7